MSAPRPVETEYLVRAEAALNRAAQGAMRGAGFELRLQVLEAAAATYGGFNLPAFHAAFGIGSLLPCDELMVMAAPVVEAINQSPIPPALALSALARETLHEQDRKSTGAYHTDFRLAMRLAELAAPQLGCGSRVIDPACGAGILLAALTGAVCGTDRTKVAHWLANGVCAADLSANSLRATLLSLASFTDDIAALQTMRNRWFCGDSLLADSRIWQSMAADGFDAVIGNPPWEKVKLSRHEFLKSSGAHRHYGAQIHNMDERQFARQRNVVAGYSRQLLTRYPSLGNGEPDLYIAFTDLFFSLCKEQGIVAALLPGGLIRSQGTQAMRKKIFDTSQSVSLSIIDNRARFFSIDTRFKFLAIAFIKAAADSRLNPPITLQHERGTATGMETTASVTIGYAQLAAVRDDLGLPEVRGKQEWQLFSKISAAGIPWDEQDYGWTPKFCREVDMTKERPKFMNYAARDALPVVEGRMVQAHRFGVKGYRSGSGRSALWEAYPIGSSRLCPQFWINSRNIPPAGQQRACMVRAGFCDIAGQTNERSLMAALIPPGVVCGNKVPTIVFPDDPSEERLLVWVAIANSFAFDWMLRRVLTTTVNYFLLQGVPLPKLVKDGLPWQKLVAAARELRQLDNAGPTQQTYLRMAQLRAEIDAEVAVAYGLGLQDMILLLQDFPILDRGYAGLYGEKKSTVTRDCVLAAMARRTGESGNWAARVADAYAAGALAYVPSELAIGGIEIKKDGTENHG